MSNDKNIFVFWSGGLDSTALIHQLLCDQYKVTAAYVNLTGNPANKREKEAIEKMLPYFEQYSFKWLGDLVTISPNQLSEKVILQQAAVWVSCLSYVPDQHTVAIGYVMGDDAISYLPEIKKAANGMMALYSQPMKLTFPLIKKSKDELWEGLPSELRDHVTWCSEEVDKCGRCPSCRKMIYYQLQEAPEDLRDVTVYVDPGEQVQ